MILLILLKKEVVLSCVVAVSGKFVHHDPRKAVEHSNSNSSVVDQLHGGSLNMNGGGLHPVQTLSNEALKVQCPFCESMFAARYGFYQHLCDRHFKDTLAAQVPANPPFLCPVTGCGYIARDSRQVIILLNFYFGLSSPSWGKTVQLFLSCNSEFAASILV